MPKIDIMKSPEFTEEAANIVKDYPAVADAPLEPTDVRSDKQWDKDARTLQALRGGPESVKMESGPTARSGPAAESFPKFKKRP